MLDNEQVDIEFCKKIIFSDETHFHLDGYIKNENYRISDTYTRYAIHKGEMHPRISFWSNTTTKECDNVLAVNHECYQEMLGNSVSVKLSIDQF